MILVIIGAIIGFYTGYRSLYDAAESRAERVFTMVLLVLPAITGALAGVVLAMAIGLLAPTHYEAIGERDLAALKDNQVTQGRFFLASGTIDGNSKYFALVKTDRGLQSQSFDPTEAYIHERAGKPVVVTKAPKGPDNFFCKYIAACATSSAYEYHFYVPPGSVTNEIKVDLE